MRSPNLRFSARASERLICAWALLDDRWLDDLDVLLLREHFEDDRFGALYAAIVATKARGLRATPDTLETWAENSGAWTLEDLFKLQGEGRNGSISEFASAVRHVVRNSNGRLLLQTLADADAHIIDNPDEDPAVLFTTIEGMLRSTILSGVAPTQTVGDLGDGYIEEFLSGGADGIRTGLTDFDARHGSFQGGELILIMGEPGSGKTTMAANLARRFSRRTQGGALGLVGHFASYEMGRSQIMPRMWSAVSFETTGIAPFEYRDLRKEGRGGVTAETIRACQAALKQEYPTLAIDVTAAQTVDELEASVRRTKRDLGGLDYIVVDYLQRMRPGNPKEDRHLQVGSIGAALKGLAQRHNVPVFALCTINRQNQQRADKRPQRSDLRESGALEYEADVIVGVHRPAREMELELRAIALDSDKPNAEYWELEDKIAACRHQLELLTLKARQGEEGTDYAHIDLPHDIIRNGGNPRPSRWGRQ